MIIPILAAIPWIWPATRSPRFWFGFCVLGLCLTSLWLGNDYNMYKQSTKTPAYLPLRFLYTMLSAINTPAIQIVFGSWFAGLISLHKPRQAKSPADDLPASKI